MEVTSRHNFLTSIDTRWAPCCSYKWVNSLNSDSDHPGEKPTLDPGSPQLTPWPPPNGLSSESFHPPLLLTCSPMTGPGRSTLKKDHVSKTARKCVSESSWFREGECFYHFFSISLSLKSWTTKWYLTQTNPGQHTLDHTQNASGYRLRHLVVPDLSPSSIVAASVVVLLPASAGWPVWMGSWELWRRVAQPEVTVSSMWRHSRGTNAAEKKTTYETQSFDLNVKQMSSCLKCLESSYA